VSRALVENITNTTFHFVFVLLFCGSLYWSGLWFSWKKFV